MKAGMTLIEIVVAMLLVGLLVLSVTLSILPATEGLLLVRDNVAASQKAQLAIVRLVREFSSISNVVSGASQTLVYDRVDTSGAVQRRTVAWADGADLTLNGVTLSDDVAAFELRYYESPAGSALASWNASVQLIEIVLQSQKLPVWSFVNRVYLRDI